MADQRQSESSSKRAADETAKPDEAPAGFQLRYGGKPLPPPAPRVTPLTAPRTVAAPAGAQGPTGTPGAAAQSPAPKPAAQPAAGAKPAPKPAASPGGPAATGPAATAPAAAPVPTPAAYELKPAPGAAASTAAAGAPRPNPLTGRQSLPSVAVISAAEPPPPVRAPAPVAAEPARPEPVAAEPAAAVEPAPVADAAEDWPAPAPRVAGAAEAGNALAGAPVQQQEEAVAPGAAVVPAAAMAWLSAEQRERIQRAAAAEAEASAAAAAAAAEAEAKLQPPPLAAAAMAALAGQRAVAQRSAVAEVPVVAAVPASQAADAGSEASAVAPAASEPTDIAAVDGASPDEEDAPQVVASAAPRPEAEPQPVPAPAQDEPNEAAVPVAEGAPVAAASAAAPVVALAAAPAAAAPATAAPAAPNGGATKAETNGWKQPDLGARPVISVRGITKVYTMGDVEVAALRGVDLDIYPGEMTAIMGPSGSGKSTLMNIIGCLDVPTDGVYLLDGEDVSRMKDDELADVRGRKIGFVFQSFNLLPRTSALANVELPLLYTGNVTRGRHKKAQEVLDLVGLGERVHHKPNELSGGQQQRVAIARALINEPAMILADEPTGNLDTKTSVEIMELFQRLNTERGITVIFVTHNIETADYCHRVVHVRDGHVERDVRHEPRAGIYRDLLPEDLTLDVLQTGAHDAMLGHHEADLKQPESEVAA